MKSKFCSTLSLLLILAKVSYSQPAPATISSKSVVASTDPTLKPVATITEPAQKPTALTVVPAQSTQANYVPSKPVAPATTAPIVIDVPANVARTATTIAPAIPVVVAPPRQVMVYTAAPSVSPTNTTAPILNAAVSASSVVKPIQASQSTAPTVQLTKNDQAAVMQSSVSDKPASGQNQPTIASSLQIVSPPLTNATPVVKSTVPVVVNEPAANTTKTGVVVKDISLTGLQPNSTPVLSANTGNGDNNIAAKEISSKKLDAISGETKNLFRSFGDMSDWSNPSKTESTVWKNFWSDSNAGEKGKEGTNGWNKIKNGADDIFNWTIHSSRRLGRTDLDTKTKKQYLELVDQLDLLKFENTRLKQRCGIIKPRPVIGISPDFLN